MLAASYWAWIGIGATVWVSLSAAIALLLAGASLGGMSSELKEQLLDE